MTCAWRRRCTPSPCTVIGLQSTYLARSHGWKRWQLWQPGAATLLVIGVHSLRYALLLVPLFNAWSAMHFFIAARHLHRDLSTT